MYSDHFFTEHTFSVFYQTYCEIETLTNLIVKTCSTQPILRKKSNKFIGFILLILSFILQIRFSEISIAIFNNIQVNPQHDQTTKNINSNDIIDT